MTQPSRGIDLLIRHAHVLTMDDDSTQVEDGAIAVADGQIWAVGPDAVVAQQVRPARTIDAGGAPVHPGLVDAHVHASFGLLRGVHPDETDEDSIVADFYVPFLNTVTDDEEYTGVLLSCLEMVRNGTTTFLEAGTVLEPAAGAAAVEAVGMRAVLADAFIWDQPGDLAQGKDGTAQGRLGAAGAVVQRAPVDLESALERLGAELRRNSDPDSLVSGHICLNGLGTASEELMLEAKARADAAGVVMSMHHAYSPADSAVDRERFGPDPLGHMARIGVLGGNVTLAHAIHLSDADADAVVDEKASLVWAPAASMLWGHGASRHGRHAELWRRGANVALASDSANWSNDMDIFRQADLALLTARDREEDRSILGAEDVLRMATRGGARAAGLEGRIGSIEVGKRADLVIHTLARPELRPSVQALRNVVHSGRSKSVSTVIIDGQIVLEDGVFTALDEERLLADADRVGRDLLRRLPPG